VALGVWRPPAPVDVDRLAQVQDERVCALVETLAALTFEGIAPPMNGTPEDYAAVQRANAQLAQRRESIMGLSGLREMGC
jgi:hypothetical protein